MHRTPHSAILTEPIVVPGKTFLDYATEVLTKNGMEPEAVLTFGDLVKLYGETYNVYTRK